MAERWRSIIRESEFEEQLDALLCNAEEAEDYLAAAEDVLSRDPMIGSLAGHTPNEIWKLALPPVRDQAVAIFYTFNDDFVILLYIVAYD